MLEIKIWREKILMKLFIGGENDGLQLLMWLIEQIKRRRKIKK